MWLIIRFERLSRYFTVLTVARFNLESEFIIVKFDIRRILICTHYRG